MHRNYLKCLLCIICIACNLSLLAKDLKTRVDKTQLSLQETLTLIIVVDNTKYNLDLKPLMSLFNILGQQSSQQITYINGKTSISKEFRIQLQPKKTGNLVIPNLRYGPDNSSQIIVTVSNKSQQYKQNDLQPVLLEASVNNYRPIVSSEVILTIKVLVKNTVDVQNLQINSPEHPDVQFFAVEQQNNLQTVIRGGETYEMQTINYIIFPQKPGIINLEPIKLYGMVLEARKNRFSQFSFFTGLDQKPFESFSEKLTLDVRTMPSSYTGSHWLPAKKIILKETKNNIPQVWKVGEPVTRTIDLIADGIPSSDLPEFEIPEIANLSIYVDKIASNDSITNTGIQSKQSYKLTLVPEQAGEYNIPEINITWWDINKNQSIVTKLPGKKFNVISSSTVHIPITLDNADLSLTTYWQNISYIFICLFLISILLNIYLVFFNKKGQNEKKLVANIKNACLTGQPKLLTISLLKWASYKWPDNAPHSLIEIADKLNDSKLAVELAILDKLLYSSTEINWDGKNFWNYIQPYVRKVSVVNKNTKQQPLPILNP